MKAVVLYLSLAMLIPTAVAQPPQPQAPIPASTPTPVVPKVDDPLAHTQALLVLEKEKNLGLSAQELTKEYQQGMAAMKQQFGDLDKQESAWEDTVRKANGWDANYTYDKDKDTWVQQTPPPKINPVLPTNKVAKPVDKAPSAASTPPANK